MSESARRTWRAAGERWAGGMGFLVVCSWAAHLSTIVWAVQDRAKFEAFVRPGLPGGLALSPFAPWVALALVAFFAHQAWLSRGPKQEGSRWRFCVREALASALIVAHLVGLGLGGSLLQTPDYDLWCAALSSTWYAVPLSAALHLLSAVVIASAARSWLERAMAAFWPRQRRAASTAYAATLLLTVLAGAIVLQLATGSYALFRISPY